MSINISHDRINEAGADVIRLTQATVLIKVDALLDNQLWRHPLWALCRGLGALGLQAIHVQGAADYLDTLANLMSDVQFTQNVGPWITEEMAFESANVDFVVDLTNNRRSKEFCASLGEDRGIPFISLCWDKTRVIMAHSRQAALQALRSCWSVELPEPPFSIISRIVAGLALQEIVMAVSRIETVAPAARLVSYNLASESRVGDATKAWPDTLIEDTIVEVIGAGGIGINLLETVVPLLGRGCQLRIFDDDHVGPENLSLQPAYTSEDVDRPKAVVIADKLRPYCHKAASIVPLVMPYQQRPATLSRPTLRVLCPDNYRVRHFANRLSLNDGGVPLLDAGSSPLAARQATYLPGRTACLEHRIANLAHKAAAETSRNSCAHNHAPTLPGTNMIIAGILAGEIINTLLFADPSTSTILYDARFPQRFGLADPRPPCFHT